MDFSGDSWRRPDLWPYQQVAAVIEEAIRVGELVPGQKLPSQQRIAQMAGVSKTAAQNALAALKDQGLVYSVDRLGTFVAERGSE